MKPYYQDRWVTIYLGDCREILPELPKVDLVLTDPPYGINHPTNYSSRGRSTLGKQHDYTPVFGDDKPFEPETLLIYNHVIIWGANHFADKLPISSGWLVWDKRVQEGKGVNDQSDGELAWTNCVKGVRIFRHMWNGMWRDSERGEGYHPTQKPVALMKWCIVKSKTDGLIIDPYMGAGATILAAKQLNRYCIGIEIEEKYCEIAAKRCSQSVMEL